LDKNDASSEGEQEPSHRDLLNKAIPWILAAFIIAVIAWRVLIHLGADLKITIGATITLFVATCLAPWFKFIEKPFVASKFSRPRSVAWTIALVVLLVLVLAVPPPPWTFGANTASVQNEPTNSATPPSSVPPTPPAGCKEPVPLAEADWGPTENPLQPAGQSTVPSFNNAVLRPAGADFRTQLVAARDASFQDSPMPNGGFAERIQVQEGKTYRVRFFVFNNALSGRPDLTITGARAFVRLQSCSSADVRLVGSMSGINAVPRTIWSTVHFLSDRPFRLIPDAQQAKVCYQNMECPTGTGFANFSMTEMYSEAGAPLGANGLDGVFPGSTAVDILFYVRPVFE
jgi:hypothetical protein